MSGYILLYRDLIGNPQFRGKNDEYAAIWILSRAVWQETVVRIDRKSVILQRGECAYSNRFLGEAWECSASTAHGVLRHLEKAGFIRTQAERGYTRIYVVNYDTYQTQRTLPERTTERQPERCPNAARTNKKELNTLNTLKEDSLGDFETWYSDYPHKVGKAAAKKAFVKAIEKASLGELVEGVRAYVKTKPPDRNWCNPATWLNQERWKDQPGETNVTDQYHDLGKDSVNAVSKMFGGVVSDRNVSPGGGRQGPDEVGSSSGQAVNAAGLRRDPQGGWVDGSVDQNLFQHFDAPRDQGGDPDVRCNTLASAGGFGDQGG